MAIEAARTRAAPGASPGPRAGRGPLATSVLDFWTLLQDIPVAERVPPLRQPVFAGLVLATIIGVFATPMLFRVIEGLGAGFRPKASPADPLNP